MVPPFVVDKGDVIVTPRKKSSGGFLRLAVKRFAKRPLRQSGRYKFASLRAGLPTRTRPLALAYLS